MSVFLKAIDIIEEYGWGQHEYMDEDSDGKYIKKGPVCIVGACTLAADIRDSNGEIAPGDFEKSHEHSILENVCESLIIYWNDNPERTKEEVINLLRKAYEYECAHPILIEDSSVQQV